MGKKISIMDVIVIGLALFAIFFGAGNLIFPPYLGMTSGREWFIGFFAFIVADIGFAFLGILAMIRGNGKISGITGVIGKVPSLILNTAVIVCIGPMLAIPRTAATTFEMGILPLTDNVSSLVFSIIFFALVLVLSLSQSKIVDIVGKVLTPLMFIALLLLIVVGFISPIGPIGQPTTPTVIQDGVIAGYQAMDMLAALGFAMIVISATSQKGYHDKKEKLKVTAFSCIVAGVILFIVYGGLTYLGATAYEFIDAGYNQAGLIVAITHALLGKFGVIMLSVIVTLACLTTAIGLTCATSMYFEEISGGRLKYKLLVTLTVIAGIIIGNFGLSKIVNISVPILTVIYPVVFLLIILSFFKKYIRNLNIYKVSVLFTLVVSILSAVHAQTKTLTFLNFLPLYDYGFGWLLPALVGGLLGAIIKTKNSNITPSLDS